MAVRKTPAKELIAGKPRWAVVGATVGYAGLSPVAPGTMGAIASLPLAPLFVLMPWWARVVLLAVITWTGWWVSKAYMRGDDRDDPQEIVVDELAGCAIAIAVVPQEWIWVGVGFVLFRYFDIVKPWPVDWLGDRHGAFGVMADDIAAGLIGAALIAAARFGPLG